jgi:DNA polymerase-1
MKQKSLIIDTSYLIYRSYFAYGKNPNNSLTYNGKPTGAIYGFIKAVVEMCEVIKPDYLCFCMDTPKNTWRHDVYEAYKANRTSPEADMVSQIQPINDWCQGVTENNAIFDGFEADDGIYSYTNLFLINYELEKAQKTDFFNQIREQNLLLEASKEIVENSKYRDDREVYIFSGDRDLYQLLVYPNVKFVQSKNKGDYSFFDRESFIDKYKLQPFQWLDYKAIVGDNSDNLIGIEGVGPVTATKILTQGHSLFQIYKALGFDPNPFVSSNFAFTESNQVDAKSFITDPKNEKLVEKLKVNYEHVIQIYNLSKLTLIDNIGEMKSSFHLEKPVQIYQDYGLESILKKLNIKSQDQDELF